MTNTTTAILAAILGGLVAAGGLAMAATAAVPNLSTLTAAYNDNASRPCIMVSGGWTTIDSDNSTGNLSGQLSDFSAFLLQCDSDAYVATGTDAAVADASDGWIAAGAIWKLGTDSASRYVSVLNKADATADCHYVECR